MRRRWIALALGLVLLGALWAGAAPPRAEAYEAPVPREERARNAAVLALLSAAGIERAWVDAADPARVLVVYERPEPLPLADAQAYALASAAMVATEDALLVARTTAGEEWHVAAADVAAHQAGALTRAELEARVVRSAPG